MMFAAIETLLAPAGWPTLVLVSARVGGMFFTAPLWTLASIPGRLRAAMALVLSAGIAAGMPPEAGAVTTGGFAVAAAVETLIGVIIGLSAAVLLHGVAVAAEVVALQMGLSLGASFSPSIEITVPGIGEIKGLLVLALYTALDGHLALVRGLGASMQILPPAAPLDAAAGLAAALEFTGQVFSVAIQAAAPLIVALSVTHAALAILNRAVPQLNTLMVSVPITVAVGLLLLGASLPVTTGFVTDWVLGLESRVEGLLTEFTITPVQR